MMMMYLEIESLEKHISCRNMCSGIRHNCRFTAAFFITMLSRFLGQIFYFPVSLLAIFRSFLAVLHPSGCYRRCVIYQGCWWQVPPKTTFDSYPSGRSVHFDQVPRFLRSSLPLFSFRIIQSAIDSLQDICSWWCKFCRKKYLWIDTTIFPLFFFLFAIFELIDFLWKVFGMRRDDCEIFVIKTEVREMPPLLATNDSYMELYA